MADPQATALAATTFINTKTDYLSPTGTPTLDECVVCLEPYTSEAAVRISGVPGCTHVIGVKCLTALLTTNPTQAKKCPICRTVWIPAPSQTRGLGDIRRHLTGRTANQDVGSGNAAVPGRHPGLIIEINSDTESDEEVTAESYQQFRQDIADIRFRARNSQLSRRQRREELAARERNGANGNGQPSMNDFRTSSSTVSAQNQTSFYPIPPVSSWTVRNTSGIAPTYDYPGIAPTRRNTDNEQPIDVDMLAPDTSPTQTRSRSSLNAETVNHHFSPTVEGGRARQLEQREEEMRNWERRLTKRERDISLGQKDHHVREQRLAQRERKMHEFVELRQRQLNELRTMAYRHEEEIRRL